MAITDLGEVYAWGDSNGYGQLGIGNKETKMSPVKIEGLSNIAKIYSYEENIIAKTKDGELYVWGRNKYGQLGIGNMEEQLSPQKVIDLNNVEDICMMYTDVVVRTKEKELYTLNGNENKPEKIQGMNNIENIYSKGDSIIARTSEGELYSWGENYYGQLGIGNKEEQSTPQKILGINNIVDVYTDGWDAIIARTSNGELYSWGRNWFGQLGIGNEEEQLTPQKILGINNIVEVYSSVYNVIAISEDGEIYGWGQNDYGKLNLVKKDSPEYEQPIYTPLLLFDGKKVNKMYNIFEELNYRYIITTDGICYRSHLAGEV